MNWIIFVILFTVAACVPTAKDNKLASTAALDSTAPKVSITATNTVQENVAGGTISITATMNKTWSKAVTIPLNIYGTATVGSDFTLSATSITIPVGSLSGSVTATITNDALYEDNETIIVIFGTPTNATVGTNITQALTIVDDEHTALLPTVGFSVGSTAVAVTEIAGTVTQALSLTLSAAATYDIFVPITISNSSTATRNSDYTHSDTFIQIPAGATTASTTVTIPIDTIYEGATAETIIFNLGTPQGATLSASTQSIVSITDNETAPTIQYSSASSSVGEATSTANLTLSLSAVSAIPLTFTISRTGGTATQGGVDFLFASPQTVTFPAQTTTITVPISIMNDNLYEGTETIAFNLLATLPLTLGAQTTHTVSITDNESLPYVRFSSTGIIISETAGTLTIPVVSSVPSQSALLVSIGIGGSSSNGTDYGMITTPVTIPANSTTGYITMNLTNDALGETVENAIFTITPNLALYNSGLGDEIHTVTIVDDDPIPQVNFTLSSASSAESAGPVTVAMTLSSASAATVSGTITITGTATSGADYTAAVVAYSFAPGITAAPAVPVTFTITDDTLDEINETVILTLNTPTNAQLGTVTTHTATITDNDATPTVNIANVGADIDLTEAVPETVTIRATLSAASGLNVTVPFTVSGTASTGVDYIQAGTLNITAGSTTADLTFSTTVGTNDGIDEGIGVPTYETIIVSIDPVTNAVLGTTPNTVTVTDDDAVPTISFGTLTDSVTESSTSKTVTVSLSNGSNQEITVPITEATSTATSSVDYVASPGQLIFPACEVEPCTTTLNINVQVLDDTLNEVDETVVLGFSALSPVGAATPAAPLTHTLTLVDEDLLVEFDFATASIAEGIFATFTIYNYAADGVTPEAVPAGGQIEIPLTITGTATSGTDYAAITTTAIITAGSDNTTVTVDTTGFNDLVNEEDETVIITMGTPTYTGVTYEAVATSPTVATTTILKSDPVTFLALGATNTCTVIDVGATDQIKCWGDNATMQLGNNDTSNSVGDEVGEMGTALIAITGPVGSPSQVVAGRNHTCGLWVNSVYCWGDDSNGQLGNGGAATTTEVPTLVTGMTNIQQISAGDTHTCAVETGGATVYCWGDNFAGQLGDGTNTTATSPVTVSFASIAPATVPANIIIAAGGSHTCMIDRAPVTDTVYCWGNNSFGQLGQNTTVNSNTPVAYIAFSGTFVPSQISLGQEHSCAFDTTNDIARCWGRNNYGQLGQGNILNYGSDGTTQSIALVSDIAISGGDLFNGIYAGGDSTCVINTAGEAKCFGYNQFGQLGIESTATIGAAGGDMSSIAAISLGTGVTATSMALSEAHTCAILSNGRIKCWGYNSTGQLGLESTSTIGDGFGEISSLASPNL